MEFKNLENLLIILTNGLEKNNFDEDEQIIRNLCSSLKDIKREIPSTAKIEKIKKDVNYLEIKYDVFNELSYYFNPIYIKIKNKIHDENIKKIREENKKREV